MDNLENLWQEVKSTVSEAAGAAKKKATELSDLAGIKLAIHNEETKLRECYTKLGEAYYNYQRLGTEEAEEITALILEADSLKASLVSLNETLGRMQK